MILVTGGTGLVGSHLLLKLAESGQKLCAIRRTNSSLEKVRRVFSYQHPKEEAQRLWDSIEWREADILDIPALEDAFIGVTSVYHCAAVVSFNPSDNKHLRNTNIDGTANVVNLCIKHAVEKLCYVSSIATLDQKIGDSEISETSAWNKELNHSMYALTKYGAEMEVWRASQEGVPVVIVNPGVIIGPGFWDSGTGQLYQRVWKGLSYYLPKTTGFVGVNDVARAMQQLMESEVQDEAFVLVSENLSSKTVLVHIANSLKKPIPQKELKPWMVFLGWMVEKSLSFTDRKRQLTKHSVKSLFTHSHYNSEKIKTNLGFEFEPMKDVITNTGRLFKVEAKG